jgi:phospholipid/cholesterol/gamma-HCH transport system substrate-binding protein
VTRDKMASILASIESLAEKAERGEGSLGRLLTDDTLVRHIETSLARLDTQLAALEAGEGLLPLLVNDAAAKQSFTEALANLTRASGELGDLAHDLREGEGLLPRLISDQEFGARVSGDLERLLSNLGKISERLEAGDGTAGQLINDPQISEAMNDILVGINESKLLRWLIRNRQKKGIEKRYAEVTADAAPQPEVP